ncbi:GNAT family N-acetyltransferase [Microbulbifer aggregans]|uniref:GNAT family N-acetyltransferase n=1 Tax=Microbulbifer aggregans TaxID=1769779 RepID=UPI001CFEEE28|nr:GNAT family N-acetyltransferase [Microbulbifer aggregans]
METIRLCREDDLLGLLKLYSELRPHDPLVDPDEASKCWEALLSSPSAKLFVAEIDGELASTCQLGIVPTITNGARPFGIIEHVVTAEQFKRRGLSQMVMEKALEEAWESGCYKVMLLSGESRAAAHKLYEKLGFKSGVERGFVIKPDSNE